MAAHRFAKALRRSLALGVLALTLALPVLAYDTGQTVQPFTGTDASGKTHSLAAYKGKTVVVVVWGSLTCKPYASQLAKLNKQFSKVVWLGVAPNAGESAAAIRKAKSAQKIAFPVLLDSGGTISKAFGAQMMPTVFVIGPAGKLRYQGAIADKPSQPKKAYLADALRAVAAGKSPSPAKTTVRGFRIRY